MPADLGADLYGLSAARACRSCWTRKRGRSRNCSSSCSAICHARGDDQRAGADAHVRGAALSAHDDQVPEFGELPITRIGDRRSRRRVPRTRVVLESAELTGMDAFEEVVKSKTRALPDPFKERLIEIARQQAPELV